MVLATAFVVVGLAVVLAPGATEDVVVLQPEP